MSVTTLILSVAGASLVGLLLLFAPRAMHKLLTVSPDERR